MCFAVGASAQDGSKLIIISPRVGSEIDGQERENFKLFQDFKDFTRAIFYLSPDSTYICLIEIPTATGAKDTLIPCSKRYLLRLAEWINHYEAFVVGEHKMGDSRTTLQVIGGNEIADDRIIQGKGQTEKFLWRDVLPFASTEDGQDSEEYPNWDFGVGLSSYAPDFNQLNGAYSAIESRYRRPNFPIARVDPDFRIPALVWYSIKVGFSFRSALLLETARNVGGDVGFTAVSASYLYYPDFFERKSVRPYVGGGIGKYYFSGTVRHGEPIDLNSQFLDEIKSEGGSTGIALLGGCEFVPAQGFALSISLNYLFIPDIEALLPEGVSAKVRLSSLVYGARLSFSL
jgi:opacity protein-like surface antigen